jgi:hypothetical protein
MHQVVDYRLALVLRHLVPVEPALGALLAASCQSGALPLWRQLFHQFQHLFVCQFESGHPSLRP